MRSLRTRLPGENLDRMRCQAVAEAPRQNWRHQPRHVRLGSCHDVDGDRHDLRVRRRGREPPTRLKDCAVANPCRVVAGRTLTLDPNEAGPKVVRHRAFARHCSRAGRRRQRVDGPAD